MKIICIGRNYILHAQELNNPIPSKPIWFLKPETTLLLKNKAFYVPDFSNDIHYEAELVFRINKLGKNIQEKFAHTYYNEVAVGVDFTARDVQNICKEKGLPWTEAKCFDGAAPLSNFVTLDSLKNAGSIEFRLFKNGEQKQHGFSKNMLFPIDKIIAYVSQFVTLKIGDLIFTGTPAGVGPVAMNDLLEVYLEDKLMLKVPIK